MAPAVAPTTNAAPIARGGAGRLPPTRSAATRVRKPFISSSSAHQRDVLRLRDEPEGFLADPEPRRRLFEELELERRDEACFFCSCGCGECECSLSWMSSNSAYSRPLSYLW